MRSQYENPEKNLKTPRAYLCINLFVPRRAQHEISFFSLLELLKNLRYIQNTQVLKHCISSELCPNLIER